MDSRGGRRAGGLRATKPSEPEQNRQRLTARSDGSIPHKKQTPNPKLLWKSWKSRGGRRAGGLRATRIPRRPPPMLRVHGFDDILALGKPATKQNTERSSWDQSACFQHKKYHSIRKQHRNRGNTLSEAADGWSKNEEIVKR